MTEPGDWDGRGALPAPHLLKTAAEMRRWRDRMAARVANGHEIVGALSDETTPSAGRVAAKLRRLSDRLAACEATLKERTWLDSHAFALGADADTIAAWREHERRLAAAQERWERADAGSWRAGDDEGVEG